MVDGFAYEQQYPYVFLQYKGTDICLDFYCDCGKHHHVDGFFAGWLQCKPCGQKYEMPFMLHPRKVLDTNTDPIIMDDKDEEDLI